MKKRILIGCPVRDREKYLPHYLQHIYNITYDKKLIDLYWIVNNSTDNSYQLLKEFKSKYNNEYNSITIEVYNNKKYPKDERKTHVRDKIYHWLSELRNKLLKKCDKLNCDYLFSCDSDILVPSNIITSLLSHEKDVVASLIYNGYLYTPKGVTNYNPILNAYKFPNILKIENNGYKHIVNYKVKNPNLNPIGTITEVDFTGAVSLITNDVCKVAYYGYHTQGEDELFSRTAKQHGFKLYCDLSVYSQHLMNEDILTMYLNKELKFNNGEIICIK